MAGRVDTKSGIRQISVDFPVSDRPTNDIKGHFSVEIRLLTVLLRVKCILPHYTDSHRKQLIRQKFLKGDFSKATKDKQQDAKKLVKEDSQRSGTGFSQIGPQFSLLIVVVKEKFASIKNIFLIII